MDKSQHTYDADIIKPIVKIEFGLLGNDEIRERSVMKNSQGVEYAELYDKSEPKIGGLIDQRMGASNDYECATCGLSARYCDGHESHIDLAEPIYVNVFVLDAQIF